MGFWTSKRHKARKEYTCEFCGKQIKIGEVYSRETGTYGGNFNDYCMCERCKWFIGMTHSNSAYTDELGSLQDDIEGLDLLKCKKCNSSNYKIHINSDRTSIKLNCKDCGEETEVDISINGLESLLNEQLNS